jgi:dTDP-4-amino-4,6-dideoxygalactose transaminase
MIPLFKVFMDNSVSTEVVNTLSSGMITQATKNDDFENKLKEKFNHPYILTLNSATAGLTLALRLHNIKNGDEVLCTPLTCFATTASVLANGAKVKWVDVDPQTCNMDLDDLKRKITEKTKAIVFVHWGGTPIDLDNLKKIAGDIPIVEDCAHAFGSKYKDRFVGTTGNISVFSLQAIKHLTTGDGGLIFLPNEQLYNRAKLLIWYGIDREKRSGKGKDFRLENDIPEWGYKFHMNDINATIGLCNLEPSFKNIEKHRENAKYYRDNLCNVSGVELLKHNSETESSYWIFTLKVDNKDKFMEYMFKNDVMVSQVHQRNDINSCVSDFVSVLPQMDELEKKIICIPCGWWVSLSDCEKIVKLIRDFYN